MPDALSRENHENEGLMGKALRVAFDGASEIYPRFEPTCSRGSSLLGGASTTLCLAGFTGPASNH